LYVRRPVGVNEPVALNVIVVELDGHEKYSRVIISSLEEDFTHLQNWYERHQKQMKKSVKKKNL
jgi:hypothetical protein